MTGLGHQLSTTLMLGLATAHAAQIQPAEGQGRPRARWLAQPDGACSDCLPPRPAAEPGVGTGGYSVGLVGWGPVEAELVPATEGLAHHRTRRFSTVHFRDGGVNAES